MSAQYFPMSQRPKPSEDVPEWSETVIVYDEDADLHDFGYFDFNEDEWHVLGMASMKLKCWCYLPEPDKEAIKNFETTTHVGYRP